MAIAHIATTSWLILAATNINRGNILSCNTHLSLLVHLLQRRRLVAIPRSSNTQGIALVVLATPTAVAKTYVATLRCCKYKMHFATLPRKVLSKALPTQALATPHNEKQMLLFMLLQLFWAYCNTFHALKQAQKLVVIGISRSSFTIWNEYQIADY